ncbi:MAG TPA: PEGA domain-containing protein [Kofleriaceae bacterium]|nr:PEGA domain-containing protein [Kofleriaceae bacterium]
MRPWLVPIALVALAGIAACRGDDGDAPARVQTRAAAELPDAGIAEQRPPAAPGTAEPEPEPEGWLDPMPDETEPWKPRPAVRASRPKRTVQLMLRSTPPGATIMIDGEHIGSTPAFWEGEVVYKPRDFVFILPGYAIGRYRFVPTHDSIVHPTLKKLIKEIPVDAGS